MSSSHYSSRVRDLLSAPTPFIADPAPALSTRHLAAPTLRSPNKTCLKPASPSRSTTPTGKKRVSFITDCKETLI